MLITEFAAKHGACESGVERALALGHSTMEELWADENWMDEDRVWVATRPGVLTDRELRLFAVWSARRVQNLMTDQRSLDALAVVERYANGEATDEELAAAETAAETAARAAAETAALAAARAAARAAGGAAGWDAGWDAGWAAALAAQARYLYENTTPRWN